MNKNKPSSAMRETHRPAEHTQMYWEDFLPGDHFDCGSRLITREEIINFASTFDPQPIHLDEEFSATTIYGGVIASGGHVWASCMGLVAASLLSRSANLGSPGLDSLRWLRPMRPGDVVTAAVTVLATEPSSRPTNGKLKLRFELRNQDQTEIMQAVANVIMGRRQPAQAPAIQA
jgi:acyl dehydratase